MYTKRNEKIKIQKTHLFSLIQLKWSDTQNFQVESPSIAIWITMG